MSLKKNIKGHIGMSNIDPDYVPVPDTPNEIVKSANPLLEVIFAVDSTGHPRSDALVYLERDTRPEIKDYIARNLLVQSVPSHPGYSDSESVLSSMRQWNDSLGRMETEEEYGQRLVKIATEHLSKNSKDE